MESTDKRVMTPLTWLIGLAGAFAALNIMSNVSSARIVDFNFFSVDAGTILFPLTFTVRDLVHRIGGKHLARRVVVVSACLSALASICFWIVSVLPADMSVGPQDEFGGVLATTWRIAVAGFASQLISELVDTEVYSAWVRRFKTKFMMGRLIVSNAVSVPLDSIVFTFVAFIGIYSFGTLVSIAWGNIVLKYLITLVFAPLIKYVPTLPEMKNFVVVSESDKVKV